MSTSTHRGHCQACGRLQMLPGGKLSQHGYTVAHGYFSGVCRGSKHEPFEQSCKLVERFIAEAQAQLAGLETFQSKLREESTTNTAFFRTTQANRKGWQHSKGSEWKSCTVRVEVVPFGDGTGSYNKFYRDGDTAWTKDDSTNKQYYAPRTIRPVESEIRYSHSETIALLTTEANRSYADWLEHEADSLRRYIAWQEARVAGWRPEALLPLEHSDKLGFVPTAPRY